MKAFAAAGLAAAASAATTEASTASQSLFDSSRYYNYGYADYYPEYDHKEELTHSPAREHHKKASTYRTNNIDIFAHSDSDDSDHHPAGHHSSHSSHSDTSEDEHHPKMMKKKHMMFLTGEGPAGDHCHEGDWCSEDSASDYTDSDY